MAGIVYLLIGALVVNLLARSPIYKKTPLLMHLAMIPLWPVIIVYFIGGMIEGLKNNLRKRR